MSALLPSFVSCALGSVSSFSFPGGGVVVCSLAASVPGRFARAASLRRLARWLGLSAIVLASPLSLGGGGVLVVVGPSVAACWAWPGSFASVQAGARAVGFPW